VIDSRIALVIGMIRGTSHDQDSRFKDKAQKMLLESKWPEKYDTKIDLSKVPIIK
jgi:hypothetical protein